MKPAKINFIFHFLLLIAIYFLFTACNSRKDPIVFSVQDEINMGKLMRDEILNNNSSYAPIAENQYPQSYLFIRNTKNLIINNNDLDYKTRFAWDFYILQDDSKIQAFITPGGYIFIYSGLLKYLNTEDQLAGILAQLIAHADQRHNSNSMQLLYNTQQLLDVVAGKNPELLTEMTKQTIGTSTVNFAYSTADENLASEYSVNYLSNTSYQCNALADFFDKLKTDSKCNNTLWSQIHPSSCERSAIVNTRANTLKCKTTPVNSNYQTFKNTLP